MSLYELNFCNKLLIKQEKYVIFNIYNKNIRIGYNIVCKNKLQKVVNPAIKSELKKAVNPAIKLELKKVGGRCYILPSFSFYINLSFFIVFLGLIRYNVNCLGGANMIINLKIVRVKPEYCDYLRKFDNKVSYNKNEKERRPCLNANYYEVKNKSLKLYKLYNAGKLPESIRKRCCNF